MKSLLIRLRVRRLRNKATRSRARALVINQGLDKTVQHAERMVVETEGTADHEHWERYLAQLVSLRGSRKSFAEGYPIFNEGW